MKKIVVSVLAALTAFSGISAASAAPMIQMQDKPAISSDVENVQYRRHEFRRHDSRGWYHGHRGYRGYRHGYRRHSDGFWYPLAAFTAGAIIGGAMSNARPAGGSNHVRWCSEHYRTYRASDNTYAPSIGVRAICHSPY